MSFNVKYCSKTCENPIFYIEICTFDDLDLDLLMLKYLFILAQLWLTSVLLLIQGPVAFLLVPI